jgi:hypothetical protein
LELLAPSIYAFWRWDRKAEVAQKGLVDEEHALINVAENELLLRCSCGAAEHIAWLVHEPDDTRGNNLKSEHDDWYLSVMLDHFSFWKRVRKAVQYIFHPSSIRYGMTADLVLRSEDVDKIAEFIQKRRKSQ